MVTVSACTDSATWDAHVNAGGGHPLQLWGWGEVKARHNWTAHRLVVRDGEEVIGGAQVLDRSLRVPRQAVRHMPRGPFWVEGRGEDVMDALVAHLRADKRGTVLTIEPDAEELPGSAGLRPSAIPILMAHTLILDLNQSADELLAAMEKKHRQYVNKVQRDGQVEVRALGVEDVDAVMEVYTDTARRADFPLHDSSYYLDVARQMGDAGRILGAFHEGEMVAFLWNVHSARTEFELYGGMTELGQKLRANYLLKWTAFTAAKDDGVQRYDMNGLVSEGVSNFKQGFAKGREDMLAGSFDVPLSPLYLGYTKGLPLVRTLMRKLRRR